MRPFSLLLALLLAVSGLASPARAADSASAAPARIVLDIADFHTFDESGSLYTEASTVLLPHPAVSLALRDGLPTLSVRRALTLEISVVSSETCETYTPVAVVFEQQGAASDPAGARNFAVAPAAGGTLLVTDRFVTAGAEGRFEFFVIVRRDSDGALGVIDPGIENQVGN